MSHNTHEEFLDDIIIEFKSKGWRVIRLSGIPVPDAIAIKDNQIVGVDVTVTGRKQTIYKKALNYKKYGFDTDNLLIISKNIKEAFKFPAEIYYYAIELRKNGYKYKEIQEKIKDGFDINVSCPTICTWCTGTRKPISVRFLEKG